ncbi:hypothetical protein MA12_gp23 [Pectobacterium phage MA12]|uniref:Uncharacterized protein n=1 Tax=Pectobacterium phage MA12 TaxID=2686474 RepID=A0A6B9RP00_9CAUD|nr:hypothetical protein JT357_gp23 [Pectobacterium phage MA12]QHI00850.1 hypothetical protein MA12_gp23 [Pectobacterium phage MA12]
MRLKASMATARTSFRATPKIASRLNRSAASIHSFFEFACSKSGMISSATSAACSFSISRACFMNVARVISESPSWWKPFSHLSSKESMSKLKAWADHFRATSYANS